MTMPINNSGAITTFKTVKKGKQGLKPPWKPGQSGNPSGRPKMPVSLVKILKQRLQEHPEDAEAIVNSLIAMGKTRELGAIKELLDRIDGKVRETYEIEAKIPIKLLFMPAEQLLREKEDLSFRLEEENITLLEKDKPLLE